MVPAGERLAEVLAAVNVDDLSAPVISNVEGKPNSAKERIKELLVRQVSAPVLWDASVLEMVSLGVSNAVEIGPGKVLSGLVKRITKDISSLNVEDVAGLKALQEG
jgi:[acyl-carrier-protein] S-malonyltransferase